MSWIEPLGDLREEVAVLQALVTGPHSPEPTQITPFHGWRVRDVIGHIVLVDRLARLALTDPAAFEPERAAFIAGTAAGQGRPDDNFTRMAAYEQSRLGSPDWAGLLGAWTSGLAELCGAAAALPENAKAPWFAGPMRAANLLKARQMEVWAYGQDVFDLCRVRRPESDRLRNIADFTVRTFGFSFANRGLPAPEERPYLVLAAPSGAGWTWNSPAATDRIEGSAVEFCLVATQRRNVADTALRVEGETARTWMRIAQCIAGPPQDGPAPGERVWRSARRSTDEGPS